MIAKEIINDNIQTIKTYHEETKHHYHKFANALGYMDWGNLYYLVIIFHICDQIVTMKYLVAYK